MATIKLTAAVDSRRVRMPSGWRLIKLDSVDSSNAAARRMVEGGTVETEGVVIWAAEQTAGRGRGGRSWVGASGNLAVSVILQSPEKVGAAAQIGFLAALSIVAAIQSVAPDLASDRMLTCKWPNDVLLEGAKVSGILLEVVAMPGGASWVVLGIGLNLRPVNVADALYPVTSLAEYDMTPGLPVVLDALLHDLYARLMRWRRDGFEPVRAEWMARAARRSEVLTIATPSGEVRGVFVGIDGDGALMLEKVDGSGLHRVLAGDVQR